LVICALEFFTPIDVPKSMRSLYAGLRAWGKTSACTMRPTRMSILAKSS